MTKIRKDYLTEEYTIIAEKRKERPRVKKTEECPFCPGNENLLPGIITEKKGKDGMIRVIPNKYAAVEKKGNPKKRVKELFYEIDAIGEHEVVIETPYHDKELHEHTIGHIKDVLKTYAERIREISKHPQVRYVALFKNKGSKAGASIKHAHTQIIGVNIFPPKIREIFEASYNHQLINDECAICKIIEKEKHSRRFITINPSFIAIAPYASKFPYEAWILPIRHVPSIERLTEKEFEDLAHILKKLLKRLDKLGDVPYNIVYLNDEPQGLFHFHIRILPRLSTWAGFEHEVNIPINEVSPEDAARFYRGIGE